VLQPLLAHRRDAPLGPAARAMIDDLTASTTAPPAPAARSRGARPRGSRG
jgi:hypothetical protein